jgi:hypothetical protein
MNKQEFSTFVMALRTYYSKESILPNEQAMALWYQELQDIPYEVAQAGLRKWVSTNKWSPTIADIREMASSVTNGAIADWSESWEKVCTALRKLGRDRAVEAMASFDEITRETVKRIGGFTYLCNSENTVSDRSRFEQVYNAIAERKKKDNQLSMPLKQMIHGIQERTLIEAKE